VITRNLLHNPTRSSRTFYGRLWVSVESRYDEHNLISYLYRCHRCRTSVQARATSEHRATFHLLNLCV
jgi:hypothetical protein